MFPSFLNIMAKNILCTSRFRMIVLLHVRLVFALVDSEGKIDFFWLHFQSLSFCV